MSKYSYISLKLCHVPILAFVVTLLNQENLVSSNVGRLHTIIVQDL